MRNTMVLSTFAVFIPVFYIFRALGMGNDGLWLAFLVFMLARAVSMGWTYRQKERLLATS
jgi:MATE family multidrug resistance protein